MQCACHVCSWRGIERGHGVSLRPESAVRHTRTRTRPQGHGEWDTGPLHSQNNPTVQLCRLCIAPKCDTCMVCVTTAPCTVGASGTCFVHVRRRHSDSAMLGVAYVYVYVCVCVCVCVCLCVPCRGSCASKPVNTSPQHTEHGTSLPSQSPSMRQRRESVSSPLACLCVCMCVKEDDLVARPAAPSYTIKSGWHCTPVVASACRNQCAYGPCTPSASARGW